MSDQVDAVLFPADSELKLKCIEGLSENQLAQIEKSTAAWFKSYGPEGVANQKSAYVRTEKQPHQYIILPVFSNDDSDKRPLDGVISAFETASFLGCKSVAFSALFTMTCKVNIKDVIRIIMKWA